MRRMGIEALYRHPRTTKPEPGHKIYPYLLRGIEITRPNQVWAMEITYIPMARGFVYLAVVLDWFSRRVLSWRVSITMEAAFCVETLEDALARHGKPEIFNTDQGSQFTGEAFTGVLADNGIAISMDGKGAWRDNVFVERLWRSVKYEEVYLHAYDTVSEARASIGRYFEFYNRRRPHASLDGVTPDQAYFAPLPLATIIDQIEHGHHVFRAYFKHAFLKQYEKFSTFLRNELCSNNLADFGLRKGLDHLDEVRQTFQAITGRFAGYQAQWLNVHVDFPLLQRIALPITIGSVRYPGIKIHDVRVIRLCEVLLHGGTHVGGWTAKQIHQAVLTAFRLSDRNYGLNQLRYDLRKLKGHGLLERDGSRYAYRLTAKGVQVALLFLFFHKRLCGPIANSRFHNQPDPHHRPNSRLEAAYHRADKAIQKIVDVLAAA